MIALVLGTLAAYAFSRFRVPGKNDMLFFILSTRMLPPVAVLIPIFLMYTDLTLSTRIMGMILLYTTFNLPFAVWMMKGFIDEIPKEYEDAAMVDGYTRFQAFYKVIVPQSIPAAAATAVFLLITVWNEFVFATQLTQQHQNGAPWHRRRADAGRHRLGPDRRGIHALRAAGGDLYFPGAQLFAAGRHLRRGSPLEWPVSEDPNSAQAMGAVATAQTMSATPTSSPAVRAWRTLLRSLWGERLGVLLIALGIAG